jgi:hypothetical protein
LPDGGETAMLQVNSGAAPVRERISLGPLQKAAICQPSQVINPGKDITRPKLYSHSYHH